MRHEEFTKQVNVSRETFLRLSHYVVLLEEWGAAINLVSRRDGLWHRHIIDSAQLAECINKDSKENIVDLGSGGGLPAIVLAIMLPNKITMVESDRRKSLFLETCIRELGLSHANVINDRIENISLEADYITARALAPLSTLLGYVQNFLTLNTICLFPKGRNYDKEWEEAKLNWSFEATSRGSLSGDGQLLEIKRIKRLGDAYDANTSNR